MAALTLIGLGLTTPSAQARGCADASASGGLTVSSACRPIVKARLVRGKAIAPASAPARVKAVIAAANKIRTKPYIYGGGHSMSRRLDRGYDCSGSVSFALRAAGFISSPMPSGSFMRWKRPGRGKWITTYANGGHMYMVVAGLSFDTSNGRNRWSTTIRRPAGFVARHPGNY